MCSAHTMRGIYLPVVGPEGQEVIMRIKETSVSIMGTAWTLVSRSKADDKKLLELAGYTDPTKRMIVLLDEDADDWSVADLHASLQATIRHELIHAFLYECGLWADSANAEHWAMNEEMIDWFALKLPAIEKACKDANAMPGQKLDIAL